MIDSKTGMNQVLVGIKSQAGSRGHSNDDSCDFFIVPRGQWNEPIAVAVVADGVTGTVGGAQASQIAVETVRSVLQSAPSRHETVSEWLEAAIVHANQEILFATKNNPQWQGMSTTIVLAALTGGKLYVMHLGDSRAYLLRDDQLYQLVADHTWAQEAVDTGMLTEDEAAAHPGRNQLMRYLGAQKGVDVDRGIIAPGSMGREEYLLTQPGDHILLCTDGLHRRVNEAELRQSILDHVGYPQDAVEALIESAQHKGERDDITAILLATGSQPAGGSGCCAACWRCWPWYFWFCMSRRWPESPDLHHCAYGDRTMRKPKC
jgi:serine/threonine protein phosphatase PrpC